jgi:Flp pilus assembly protein TadG
MTVRPPNVASRRAAVTVEFALVCPIFLLIVLGTIEYSRINIIRHSVDNAAYEAARLGIVPGATVDEVTAKAQQLLAIVRIQSSTITVTPNPLNDDSDEVTVTIDVPVANNSWLIPQFGAGLVIRGTSTLRTERYRGF